MDKSKLGAIAVLAAIGAALFFSKAQESPLGEEKPEAPAQTEEPAAQSPKMSPAQLTGGVTKLKIEDLKAGAGPGAKNGDALQMNYKGTLLNGEVFDQSYGRAPFDFTLGEGRVIKGWDQGIQGMKVGGKRKLTIPASLGYGDTGSPPKIPGGATLLFEVELLKIGGKAG